MVDTSPDKRILNECLGHTYKPQYTAITTTQPTSLFTNLSIDEQQSLRKQILVKWGGCSVCHILANTIGRILKFMLPSFLSWQTAAQNEQRLQPTAWLDGLRGIASLLVFIYHYIYAYYPQHEFGYDGILHTNIIQLPILRLLYAGPAMVKVFFVISGFALSWKPMKVMSGSASNRNEKLLDVLSSSILRRYPRLFLPILARSIVVALLVHLGACQWIDRARKLDPHVLPGHYEYHPLRTKHITEQMTNMWREFSVYAFDNILYSPKRHGYYTDVSITFPMI